MGGVELWGDVATWLAGVGTTAAVGLSLWATRREHRVRVEDDRRAQASLVAAWLGGWRKGAGNFGYRDDLDRATVSNGSDVPIYEVVLTVVIVQGSGARLGSELGPDHVGRVVLDVIPPGAWYVEIPYSDWRGTNHQAGIEVAFRDASGKSWVRRATGELDEISTEPAAYYRLPKPLSFEGVWRAAE